MPEPGAQIKARFCLGDVMRDQRDNLEMFLTLQEHAKIQQDTARERDNEVDAYYWQGVKDGLRRLYAAIFNDPDKIAIGGSSQNRPPGARESWRDI